jgi:adenine-specific DNA-methyltransferase
MKVVPSLSSSRPSVRPRNTTSRSEVDMRNVFGSEKHLISAALALGARLVPQLSNAEEKLATGATELDRPTTAWLRRCIQTGADPLGEGFCGFRSPEQRRAKGATYTPPAIINAMVAWAKRQGLAPARIIDPGSGSGRFLVAAGRIFPQAQLVGVDIDPLAALMTRGHLAAAGFASHSCVFNCDYRSSRIPKTDGKTLYLGNPPYVRHHLLGTDWKRWLSEKAEELGHQASQLAGLHVHFFLATVLQATPGDLGCFVTAAEWMDVNYGQLVRELFLRELGGLSLAVIEPTAQPFSDAATTAVITAFEIGAKPKRIRVKRIDDIAAADPLYDGRSLPRKQFEGQARWSPLTRATPKDVPAGYVELGELCKVHRGQVTGANRIWIAGEHSQGLPSSVLFPSVTKARELFNAGMILADSVGLRRVIDLPVDLSELSAVDRKAVMEFLRRAKRAGADKGYIAKNRRAWWSVGLKQPAPILASYMARRPPAFVLNQVAARHINIAHGLYPREAWGANILARLVKYLSQTTSLSDGRTYAGGLTKFEPGEMERIPVPGPALLLQLEA